MIRNIERKWFEVWGNEEAQNRILKMLLIGTLIVVSVQTVALLTLALRRPLLIAVSDTESRVLSIMPPPAELLEKEVRRTLESYLASHYNWDWQKIENSFQTASKYVAPEFQRQFMKANAEQIRIVKEKKLSQVFYVSDIQINTKAKTATVQGDRILVVENLRATNPMTLQVNFDYGARNENNPQGIYVTADKLITNKP